MNKYISLEALKQFPIRKDRCDKKNANEHFIWGIESVLEYAENLDPIPEVKDKIYVVMVMTKLEKDIHGCPDFGSTRIVGFFWDKMNAFDSVMYNCGDIYETCYEYALIEEVESGFYNPAQNRWWFKHDDEWDEYRKIPEPDFCNRFVGHTIG